MSVDYSLGWRIHKRDYHLRAGIGASCERITSTPTPSRSCAGLDEGPGGKSAFDSYGGHSHTHSTGNHFGCLVLDFPGKIPGTSAPIFDSGELGSDLTPRAARYRDVVEKFPAATYDPV